MQHMNSCPIYRTLQVRLVTCLKEQFQACSTSAMAVNTDSPAFEPDFQVPNPTAGMVWPLNKEKYSACWSCGVTVACAMLCFLSRFSVLFLDLVVEIHVTCLYKAPWITACKTRSRLLELACPNLGQLFDTFAYHFFLFSGLPSCKNSEQCS